MDGFPSKPRGSHSAVKVNPETLRGVTEFDNENENEVSLKVD